MKEDVPAALAGERIDRVIAALTGLPRATVAELIDSGEVSLSGKTVTKPSVKVSEGQSLELEVPEVPSSELTADATIAFEVLYSDDDIVVVDKPAGLVVHPGHAHESDTLVNGLLARFPEFGLNPPGDPKRPGIVHRLDSGTSGLLLVARTPRAYDALVAMMKGHVVERRYAALVWGDVQPDNGVIDAPIGRSDRDRTKMAVSSGGRTARTHYSVVERFASPSASLVDAKLETGRTHQIRVHFAAIGHAVVGDARYRGVRPALSVARLALHAQSLTFVHPFTNEEVMFSSPLPADLEAVLQSIRDTSA